MCEYCKDWKTNRTLYQENVYVKLIIDHFGNNPMLIVEGKVDDGGFMSRINQGFKINYCPNCGEKLRQ